MSIWTVDSGHSGATYNKGAAPGYYESKIMWDLHLRFAEALEAYGPAIRLTRTTLDANPGLVARGEMAKGSKGFISFHSNAENTGKADYPLGIYFVDDNCGPVDEESKELAKDLSNAVAVTIGTEQAARIWTRSSSQDRDGDGHKDDYYGVLRGGHNVGVPGVILECGFHTHPKTAAWLMVDDNRQKLAEALAKTIADRYGYKKSSGSASSSSSSKSKDETNVTMDWLHKGDKGEQVKVLQALLIGYGYKDKKGKTLSRDGSFGANTDFAVRNFQSRNGLNPDGIVGDNTWAKLLGQTK